MKVTILGCGSAPGVPSLSSGWGKCDPNNPKNRRRRSSILVEDNGVQILVDTSPDLREQLINADVKRLDAVLFTHAHADHIHGVDELREVNRLMKGAAIPAYAGAETLGVLETRFGYVFEGIPPGQVIFRPWLVPNAIAEDTPFTAAGMTIRPFVQDHGFSTTTGFRFGDIVYSTDVLELSDAARDVIRGAKVWIVGALSEVPLPTHAHLDKALGWIKELKPHRAVITHMGNSLDYERLLTHLLPVGVTPAYDGMVIEA